MYYYVSTNHLTFGNCTEFREVSFLGKGVPLTRYYKLTKTMTEADWNVARFWVNATGLSIYLQDCELAGSDFIEDLKVYFYGKCPGTIYLKGTELHSIVQRALPEWRVVDFEERLQISEADQRLYECENHSLRCTKVPERFHHCRIAKVVALKRQVRNSL